MKTFALALLSALALLAGTAATASSSPGHGRMLGVVAHHGHARLAPRAVSRTASSTTDASCGTACASYESTIDQYFTDVAHDSGTTTNVYSAATQYSSISYDETFGGSTVDTNAYPANGCNDTYSGAGDGICLNDVQLQNEIKSVIASKGWPTGTANLYFIFTPANVGICFDTGSAGSGNQCDTNAFCAYHNSVSDSGSQVVYGVEPDNEMIPTGGCDYNVQDPNSVYVDPTINTISHEQNEAITDPLAGNPAWYANDGSENGDLCAWTFGNPVAPGGNYNQAINGDHYWLQEEYSNEARSSGGCVQHRGGTANPAAISGDGVGPLVYHGGPVMTTNTVRAIYWIPTASSGVPANGQPPVVSGVAAAGKTLTTSTGSWTNSPAGYTYQWQSCSATGTACVDIVGANGSSYQLASIDAGHEIRSEVSAHNTNGASAYVPSSPTNVVVPLPALVVAPAVSGVDAVGHTLSTTQGTWNTPSSYAYQWLRCSATGTGCTGILGATSSTYKLKQADATHEIEAQVSATNAAGTTPALTAPTAVVIDVPHASTKPRISGTAKVGKTLSADTGSWTNAPTSFGYAWLRCSARGTSCKAISGATAATYKLTRHDAKHKLRVKVTATNVAGSGTATSGTTHLAAERR